MAVAVGDHESHLSMAVGAVRHGNTLTMAEAMDVSLKSDSTMVITGNAQVRKLNGYQTGEPISDFTKDLAKDPENDLTWAVADDSRNGLTKALTGDAQVIDLTRAQTCEPNSDLHIVLAENARN